MLAFTHIPRPTPVAEHTTALTAEYVQFDQRRRHRLPYVRAFGGLAILVLGGAVFHFVPAGQAELAAALFAMPAVTLGIAGAIERQQLVRRLGAIRAELHSSGKS